MTAPTLDVSMQARDGEFFAAVHAKLGALFVFPREPYRWLTDPKTAMLSCVIPMIWAGIGPGCLIYLAALKGIPEDYYEAADLDGANFVDKILFVVFPILKPLILINFIGVFIASWYGAEGNILPLTAGEGDTEVAGLHILYKAFRGQKYGEATAMAWVLAFMLIGFTVFQLRTISKLEFRTTGKKE
jgi:multiple sugar transport system permease protein